jgi:hypothetical protein
MATINLLSRLVNGSQRQVDISLNALAVGSLIVGGTGGTTLTQTILNNLISLQNGSEVGATLHTHDTIYTRTSALASASSGSAGSTLIGDNNSYSNFTPTAATVKGALSGIDSALAGVSGSAITSLTGDVTASGPGAAAATVAKIQGKTVSGTTGTGNVVFSASPTLTGTIGAAAMTLSSTLVATGAISGSNLTSGGHASLDILASAIGSANGVAPLDSSSKIPVAYLPSVVMEYQGSWNPNTNTPTLSDSTGTNGYVYYVSAADTGTVSGLTDPSMTNFQLGDLIIYSSSVGKWQLVTPAAGVSYVNGAQGAVTVNAINQLTGDVTAGPASGSQSKSALIASIQGTTVGGTTGTGNVVFSASPTISGTMTAAAANFSGAISASNFSGSSSGTNTGDQTITLTGDVTGSGTGSFAATIGAAKVTNTKVATNVFDQVTIVGGAGSPASVASSPSTQFSGIAGQAFTANKTYAVRYGLPANGETAGSLYACDITTSSYDLFWCIGFIQPLSAVSIGNTLTVIQDGLLSLLSGDTAFGSNDPGKPIFLQSGGIQASTTPPSTTGQAVAKLGIVVTTSSFRAQICAPYVY